jgi:hypothetical protein
MPVRKETEIKIVEISIESRNETNASEENGNEDDGEPILLTYKPLAEHRFTNPHILSQMEFNEFGVLVRKRDTSEQA